MCAKMSHRRGHGCFILHHSGFFGRSSVISASLCVSVQAPLTARTVWGGDTVTDVTITPTLR